MTLFPKLMFIKRPSYSLLISIALLSSNANAAGPAKFHATVITSPPNENYPSGRPYLTLGLHPTSSEIAKANACMPLHSAGGIEECLSAKTYVQCRNGGYFAVAHAQSLLTPMTYNEYGHATGMWRYGEAYGVACGHKSDEAARNQALSICQTSSRKKSIPEPAIILRQSEGEHYNCKVIHSGLNDGSFEGNVINFQALMDEIKQTGIGFLASTRINCWGKSHPEFKDRCPK